MLLLSMKLSVNRLVRMDDPQIYLESLLVDSIDHDQNGWKIHLSNEHITLTSQNESTIE